MVPKNPGLIRYVQIIKVALKLFEIIKTRVASLLKVSEKYSKYKSSTAL